MIRQRSLVNLADDGIIRGEYTPGLNQQIRLYFGSDLSTLTHELSHFRYAHARGIDHLSMQLWAQDAMAGVEPAAENLLRNMGFERVIQ